MFGAFNRHFHNDEKIYYRRNLSIIKGEIDKLFT